MIKQNKIHRFPWNQATMLSYIVDILIFHNIASVSYFTTSASLILLFVSICLHHSAFYKRLQYTLDESKTLKNHQNMDKIIRNVIEFHISVKEYVEISNIIVHFYNYLVILVGF